MRPSITPTKQAGSWMLKQMHILVAKEGTFGARTGEYFVEIVNTDTYNVAFVGTFIADGPCEAAVDALVTFRGPRSKEVNEFVTHYPCKGGKPYEPDGIEIDADLDGVGRLPAWIR